MSFPYISQIYVNNCYASKDFGIPQKPITEFKHIILTGKNGSGKTTILNRLAAYLVYYAAQKKRDPIQHFQRMLDVNPDNQQYKKELETYSSINPSFLNGNVEFLFKEQDDYIFSFFKAHRRVELSDVTTVTKEDEFYQKIKNKRDTESLINQFKQYLVNKKVYEAFDLMNGKTEKTSESKNFFDGLTQTLRDILKDEKLQLEFVQESFEFYLQYSDSRRITFNQLSEGFSAFLSIIVDLLMRVDLMRKAKNDYNLDPQGIVLIDEPETHFHLSMQYEILPLITALFPRIQLIVATHSPAIISSLKNSIVYDLTSRKEVSDWLLGSSYSELMIKHFGLENEFSPTADKILSDINVAIQESSQQKLQDILIQNEKYLTPSLRLEIESQIFKIENRHKFL